MRELMKANAALLFAGIAGFIVMGAGQSLYGPTLAVYARQFGISIGAAGILVSAHWVGCAIGVAVMYFHAARATPRHVLFLMALGSIVMAAGPHWIIVLIGAWLFGCGYGAATVVFNPRMLQAFGPRGPAMLSLLNATFGIGAIAAPLVFVALGSAPMLVFGLLGALTLLVWLGSGGAGRPEQTVAPQKRPVFRPDLPFLLFPVIAIGIEATLAGLGPAALVAAGLTEPEAAKLLSVYFVSFLAARIGLIFIAHLIEPFFLFTLAVAAATAASLAAALIDPSLGFVALGLCVALFFPGFFVAATNRMGPDPRVAPTIIAAGLVGGIFMPLLFAPFLAALGKLGFFWVMAGLSGGLTLAALIVMSRAKAVNQSI